MQGAGRMRKRYFSEAVRLDPHDPVATAIVARIDELFAIEAEARQQALSLEARHALRQQQSRPLLDVIQKQIEVARSTALLGGALAKACNYTLTLWDKLTRFLEYPELELSNNLAENSMRPVALGRKNWIHVGSAQAGPKIAAILSIVESCRRLKFPVRDCLAKVPPGSPASRFDDLLNSLPQRSPRRSAECNRLTTPTDATISLHVSLPNEPVGPRTRKNTCPPGVFSLALWENSAKNHYNNVRRRL
jgi:hypothetical protein